MRRFLIGPAGLACAAILACSGGKGGGGLVSPPPGPVATFQCDDSAAATDQVVLRCGAQVAADVWRIDVVIGVPTTSTDINGFVFDVVYDPLLLAYVPGSARAGTVLISDGGPQLFAAALEPGHPGDLVVGINRPSADGGGVAGILGHDLIMSFQIRSQTAAPFGPEFVRFEKTMAVDSAGAPIPGITFSDQLLLSLR